MKAFSNVFRVNGIQEVEWHVFVVTPQLELEKGKQKAQSGQGGVAFDSESVRDPILRAFLSLSQESIACSWRYASFEQRAEERGFREVIMESDSDDEEEEEEGVEKKNFRPKVEETPIERIEEKELWVFAPVKNLPAHVANDFKSLTEIRSGVWRIVTANKDSKEEHTNLSLVTRMFFNALQNKLKRLLELHAFQPFGEGFLAPSRWRGNAHVSKDMVFCSFVFFICGSHLCFNLVVQHRHLRSLNEQELEIEGDDGSAKVIASPRLMTGILKGPELRPENKDRVLNSWLLLHQVNEKADKGKVMHVISTIGSLENVSLYFPSRCLFRPVSLNAHPSLFLINIGREQLGLLPPIHRSRTDNKSKCSACFRGIEPPHLWSLVWTAKKTATSDQTKREYSNQPTPSHSEIPISPHIMTAKSPQIKNIGSPLPASEKGSLKRKAAPSSPASTSKRHKENTPPQTSTPTTELPSPQSNAADQTQQQTQQPQQPQQPTPQQTPQQPPQQPQTDPLYPSVSEPPMFAYPSSFPQFSKSSDPSDMLSFGDDADIGSEIDFEDLLKYVDSTDQPRMSPPPTPAPPPAPAPVTTITAPPPPLPVDLPAATVIYLDDQPENDIIVKVGEDDPFMFGNQSPPSAIEAVAETIIATANTTSEDAEEKEIIEFGELPEGEEEEEKEVKTQYKISQSLLHVCPPTYKPLSISNEKVPYQYKPNSSMPLTSSMFPLHIRSIVDEKLKSTTAVGSYAVRPSGGNTYAPKINWDRFKGGKRTKRATKGVNGQTRRRTKRKSRTTTTKVKVKKEEKEKEKEKEKEDEKGKEKVDERERTTTIKKERKKRKRMPKESEASPPPPERDDIEYEESEETLFASKFVSDKSLGWKIEDVSNYPIILLTDVTRYNKAMLELCANKDTSQQSLSKDPLTASFLSLLLSDAVLPPLTPKYARLVTTPTSQLPSPSLRSPMINHHSPDISAQVGGSHRNALCEILVEHSLSPFDVALFHSYPHRPHLSITHEVWGIDNGRSSLATMASASTVGHALCSLSPVLSDMFGAGSVDGPMEISKWLLPLPPTPTLPSVAPPQPPSKVPEYIEELVVPSLLVGYKEEWLVIPPSGMKFWEKAQLEGYAPKKNVSYYVICPKHDLLAIQVSDYFKELSCIYESCNLGRHQPVNSKGSSNGLYWVETTETHSSSLAHNAQLLHAYRVACKDLGQQLCEDSLQYTGDSTVVYCVIPTVAPGGSNGGPEEEISPLDIADCLAEILKLTQSQPHLNIAFQMVPMQAILEGSTHIVSLKDQAFTVFNKCRRVSAPYMLSRPPNKQPKRCDRLFEPVFILSGAVRRRSAAAKQNNIETTPQVSGPPNLPTLQKNTLHCSYCVSHTGEFLLCALTDTRGEMLYTFHIPFNQNQASQAFSSLYKRCLRATESVPEGWSIVIGKLGIMSLSELTEWKDIIAQKPKHKKGEGGHGIKNVLVASLAENSWLQLIASHNLNLGGLPSDIYGEGGDIWRQITSAMSSSADANAGTRVSPTYIIIPPICTYYPDENNATQNHNTQVFDPVLPLATSCIVTPHLNPSIFADTPILPIPPNEHQWPVLLMISLNWFQSFDDKPIEPIKTVKEIGIQWHGLSWLNIGPQNPNRHSTLPFHFCVINQMQKQFSLLAQPPSKLSQLAAKLASNPNSILDSNA